MGTLDKTGIRPLALQVASNWLTKSKKTSLCSFVSYIQMASGTQHTLDAIQRTIQKLYNEQIKAFYEITPQNLVNITHEIDKESIIHGDLHGVMNFTGSIFGKFIQLMDVQNLIRNLSQEDLGSITPEALVNNKLFWEYVKSVFYAFDLGKFYELSPSFAANVYQHKGQGKWALGDSKGDIHRWVGFNAWIELESVVCGSHRDPRTNWIVTSEAKPDPSGRNMT